MRQTLNDTLAGFSNQALRTPQTETTRVAINDTTDALAARYSSGSFEAAPQTLREPALRVGQAIPDLQLLPTADQIYIPELEDTALALAGPTARLNGEELALAGPGTNQDGIQEQVTPEAATISALLQTIELSPARQDSAQDGLQVAQAAGLPVDPNFRSTATLKTLPSGRSMSWVTPGLVMTEQHNPLYLDQRGYCALTFDDGPDRIKDNRIMDILRAEGVPATFFVLGNKLKGAEATIARMLAEGHEVGNHSWSHPQLTKLSAAKARSQIERTSRALERLGAVVRVFRPPYGDQNKRVRQIGQDLGMRSMLWDVDSLDWKVRRAASIRAEIDDTADRGSVILMHSHVNGTVEALPQIINDLRAKGCQFVTASQWFDGLNSYGMPLPQRRARVAKTPKPRAAEPAVVAPSVPSTSYQWDPNPVPSYPVTPSQPAAGEPIYIY